MTSKFRTISSGLLVAATLGLGIAGAGVGATEAQARQLWAAPGTGSISQTDGRLSDGRLNTDGRLSTNRQLWA